MKAKAAPDSKEQVIQRLEAAAKNAAAPRVQPFPIDPNPGMSIEEFVRFTVKAYDEAYAEAADLPEEDRQYVAQMAFRCVLPIMDTPNSAKAFIACVAVGSARGWLKPDDTRSLAYTAQLALAALKGGR